MKNKITKGGVSVSSQEKVGPVSPGERLTVEKHAVEKHAGESVSPGNQSNPRKVLQK